MDYYIVRIYDRRPEEGRLVGTVEDAEGRQGRTFQCPEHLLCFLWGCADGGESGGPDADCHSGDRKGTDAGAEEYKDGDSCQ